MTIDDLLVAALKVGISIFEFWDLTPREAMQAMSAALWRMELERRGRGWLAWHTAALLRMQHMPSLTKLLGIPDTKVLTGDELKARRQEFEDMKRSWEWRASKQN